MQWIILIICILVSVCVCTQVYPADSFADTTCVTTHQWYPNVTRLLELAQESGIRIMRQDFSLAAQSTALGLKTMIAIPTYQSTVVDQASLQAYLADLKNQIVSGNLIIDSWEGPNEPNGFWPLFGYTYGGQGYPDGVLPMLQDIYNTIKADEVLSQWPIIGAAWSQAGSCPWQNGELGQYVDWGDMHPYPTWNYFSVPQAYAGVDNYFGYTNDPVNTVAADYAPDPFVWNLYYPAYSPKPMAFSETGYATVTGGISETVHAKYITRLFLENFRIGIKRTCIYELYDEGYDSTNQEENFGLVRVDYSLKPAYLVIQGLLGLLNDPGDTFTPTPIDMEVEVKPVGDYTWTQFVHNLVFQKRDGDYYVALWHEIALMDTHVAPYVDLPPAPDMPTSFSFPGLSISQATEYYWDDAGNIYSQPSIIIDGSNISTVAQPQVRLIRITFGSPSSPTSAPSDPPTDAPTAAPASVVCAGPIYEDQVLSLTCPLSSQVITEVQFVSYGTPEGSCGTWAASSCDASTSTSVFADNCLNQNSCSFTVGNGMFGDPCFGTYKHFDVQVKCDSGPAVQNPAKKSAGSPSASRISGAFFFLLCALLFEFQELL